MTHGRGRIGIVFLCCLSMWAGPALAEEVENKLRIGLTAGGYNTQDEVRSPSSNFLILTDELQRPILFFEDPRSDSAAIGDLKISPASRATLSASYGVTRLFVLEASVGYQKSEVGDVEIQGQYDRDPIPNEETYIFRVNRIPAGEITQIPVSLSAFARFRPKARLNPYLGGGVGYTVVGFDSSSELDQLSANLDGSIGAQATLLSFPGGFSPPSSFHDLSGATVDARDTFAWHVGGGMEYGFRKNWSAVVDMRYVFASRAFRLRFDGQDSLGVAVPDRIEDANSEFANMIFGPVQIIQGGLVDAGRLIPKSTSPPETDCRVSPNACVFVPQPDGTPDSGFYYVQGGSVKYGGVSLQIGARYTF